MSVALVDTSVASLLFPQRRATPTRVVYERALAPYSLALPFQAYAELWTWAEQTQWGPALRGHLATFLAGFALFGFTPALGQTWARVTTEARRAGRRLEPGDAWIAATAVLYGVPLVTHDADFVGLPVTGLRVICHA